VVSHCHDIEGWAPEKKVDLEIDGRSHTVFLWKVVSAKVAESLAPFVPTPMPVVRKMLDLAGVTKDDVVYDLGCGDGRIVVEAAKQYGARGVGIDFDQERCREARERAQREGVADRVVIRHGDILQADFSDATVVTLYLLPTSNVKLRPKLEALRPGTRIVSHDFAIGDWEPIKKEVFTLDTEAQQKTIYLWRVGESGGSKEGGAKGR
jgi:SAM-dependent methyltransferase